jgi:predicted ATPase
MIKSWAIGNFKSIREQVTLELGQLTLFSGVNSSGKSTLIQSMLMVAQSLGTARAEDALVFNGRLIQMGQWGDVCHYGRETEPLTVTFEWRPTGSGESRYRFIRLEAEIRQGKRPTTSRAAAQSRPMVQQVTLSYEEDAPNKPRETSLRSLRVEAVPPVRVPGRADLPPSLRRQIDEGHFNYAVTKQEPPPDRAPAPDAVERVGLAGLLPQRLLVVRNSVLRRLTEDVEWLIGVLRAVTDSNPTRPRPGTDRLLPPELGDVVRLAQSLDELEPRRMPPANLAKQEARLLDGVILAQSGRLTRGMFINELERGRYPTVYLRDYALRLQKGLEVYQRQRLRHTAGEEVQSFEEQLLAPDHRAVVDEIGRVARERVYYLGPLRDEPRVIYRPPPHSDQWSVGLKGEYTAAVLDSYANYVIPYPLPPDNGFEGEFVVKHGRLSEAVVLWLRRLGLVDSVDTEETPKVGFRLTVNSPGLPIALDLKSVGVGVSQVLPTLVQALLAPPGSTLLFEQPELHLHPKAQAELADFFLGMTEVGKQCLVETHSEQMITRLRRRIVEARRDQVRPRLRIYFAERRGAETHFRAVQPDEYGTIVDWPEGFFDQSDLEASKMLREQIRKSREALAGGGKR